MVLVDERKTAEIQGFSSPPNAASETCRPQVAILTDEVTRGYCRTLVGTDLEDVATEFNEVLKRNHNKTRDCGG